MFASSCSLRSAQCATLIALAAAAGISRFEPAPAKPMVGVAAIVRVLAAVAKTPPAPTYPVSITTCVHALPAAPATLRTPLAETVALLALAADATDSGWSPTAPAIESEISFFDWVGAVPTAREHSYPYAVGPPRRGTHTPLRVAGNALPGDSSTRRSQVSRIARVSEFHFASGAHVTRTADSGPASAESIFPPSSAPRAGFARAQRVGRVAFVPVSSIERELSRCHFSPPT